MNSPATALFRFAWPGAAITLLLLSATGICAGEREICLEPATREAAYRVLRQQVNCLNHDFAPFGAKIHDYASVRHADKRMLRIDERVQHVNAQVILREARPERVQAEIDWIYKQLRRVKRRQERCLEPEQSGRHLFFWHCLFPLDSPNDQR